jgi:hypothetical protein
VANSSASYAGGRSIPTPFRASRHAPREC